MSFKQTINLRKGVRSFLIACAVVGLAALIRIALGAWLDTTAPFLTFFPAVLLAAMLGGWFGGLSATVLTLVVGAISLPMLGMPQPPIAAIIVYLVGCGIAIGAAERMRRASERYRAAEHKLATALGVSGVGIWRWDVDKDRVEWDERLCRIFGVDPHAAPRTAADFMKLVVEEDRPMMMGLIQSSLSKPQASEFVYRISHPQTGLRWIADRNNVLCAPDGKPIELVGASMDVTDRKQVDEQRDLLIRELHHRVRNTLAMVQGMANATANTARDLAHFKETFARRIASLAMTHALLTDAQTQSTTLSRLVRQELEALGMSERLAITGADLLLPSDLAVPIGMAMHELATNAVKYGALSSDGGHIRVDCELTHTTGEIVWSEIDGPLVEPPSRRGFGAQLLERVIAMQLGAKTTRVFAPDGLCVTISIPREKLTANANENPAALRAEAS